jgi:hypothetical protein
MLNKKTDFYTLIHKAQRAHLFALCSRIGRTDFSDPSEIKLIKQELEHNIAHLRDHSNNEDTFIHPLFKEVGNQSLIIDHEHDELEEGLLKLERIVEEKKWEELYSEFNRFIASYLMHQDEEERAQEEILWKHFDEARLSSVMNAFKASRSPSIGMQDLKFMIPCLSIPELTQMFNGMKLSAPQPAFQAACQIAETELEPIRWDQLRHSIL